MVRAPCYDENGVKKGAWSREEDEKLRSYIEKYGNWNWRELPKCAGLSRCGKSCRLRWVNYLQPNLRRGNYSKEEEDTIVQLHDVLGNKWSTIAAQLRGRTDNEIKNYWHTHLKNRGKKNRKTTGKSRQSNETSEVHDNNNQNREYEVERFVASIPSNQILESSPLYPDTSNHQTIDSSTMSPGTSSCTTLSSTETSSKWVSQDTITSLESYAESSGDFWTEPFVSDSSYMPNECPSVFLDGAYISPYNNGDTTDWFYSTK